MIFLAHGLGLQVTAENVENCEQLAFLAAEGCDRIQGYLASRPLTSDRFAARLRAGDSLLPRTLVREARARRPVAAEFRREAAAAAGD